MNAKKLGMGAVIAAAVAIATPRIAQQEGYAPEVYRDPVGIQTYCYGETENVEVGRTYSKEFCTDLLTRRVGVYIQGVRDSIPSKVYMYPSELAAWGSFSYNVGIGAFRKSTAAKLLREGRHVEACNQLPKWVYAGGKRLPGLVNRRKVEQALCLREYIKG